MAGSATLKKIESAVASASSGKITTESLDWFNGGKYVIPNGAVFQIKDVSTGLIFSARRQSGGNHMDAEPLTAEDTAILKKINGGTFSWRRRAVLVKYNGHVYAASIYSNPTAQTQFWTTTSMGSSACTSTAARPTVQTAWMQITRSAWNRP